jgi:hypothetical protein
MAHSGHATRSPGRGALRLRYHQQSLTELSLSLKDIQPNNRKSRKTNFLQLSLGQQPLKIVITSGYYLTRMAIEQPLTLGLRT